MAEFPVDPRMAKCIINAERYKCLDQVITICAMLSIENMIFYRPRDKEIHADNAKKGFYRPGGDPLTLLAVFEQWKEVNYSTTWCNEHFVQVRGMK